jgi:hypothetical protein
MSENCIPEAAGSMQLNGHAVRKWLWLASACLCLVSWLTIQSCKKVNEKSDVIGNARHLMNEGKYEEALGGLKAETQKGDVSSEVRILTASAYAGSVGLNLVDSFTAFEELLFKNSFVQKAQAVTSEGQIDKKNIHADAVVATSTPATAQPSSALTADTSPIENRENAERELLDALTNLTTASNVIFGLKWVPPEKRVRILRAAQQLDQVPKSDSLFRSASIYKIVIFSSLFMSTFRDSIEGPKEFIEDPMAVFCKLNVQNLIESTSILQVQLSLLKSPIEDLRELGANEAGSLKKMIHAFSRLQSFFVTQQSARERASFLHGALRNEICK